MKYANRILSHDSLSPDIILNLLIKRQSELTKLLKSINSRLHNAPTGTLRIAKRGNAPQYYHRLGPKDIKGTYIKKKQLNLIKNLAQKEYDITLSILNICMTHLTKQEKSLLILYIFPIMT